MKNTLKLTFLALGFAAFTTSCDNASKTAEDAAATTENAVEGAGDMADEAVTPEAGDTAVLQNKEADAVIERDSAEANAAKTEVK